jgi:hypothetical protein
MASHPCFGDGRPCCLRHNSSIHRQTLFVKDDEILKTNDVIFVKQTRAGKDLVAGNADPAPGQFRHGQLRRQE